MKAAARMLRAAPVVAGLLFGAASVAAADPVIDGVNLSGFTTVINVSFTVVGGTYNGGMGSLYLSQNAAGDVFFALVQPIGLNNNAYGTTAVMNGTGGAAPFNWSHHALSDLLGSDQAQFQFYNGAGTKVFDFLFDYATASGSSYVTCGDGVGSGCTQDAGVTTGTGSWLLQYKTSLVWDLANFPSYTTNSPTPTQQPNWNNYDIYEGEISHLAFGASGFGSVNIPLIHDSPPDNSSGSNKWHGTCLDASGAPITCTTTFNSTPEPASLFLLGSGLVGMAGFVRRRRLQA